eukprot:Awhi_evm1s8741
MNFVYPSSVQNYNSNGQQESNYKGDLSKSLHLEVRSGGGSALVGSTLQKSSVAVYAPSIAIPHLLPSIYQLANSDSQCVFHISSGGIVAENDSLQLVSDFSSIDILKQMTNVCILTSHTHQEAHDLALIAHVASLRHNRPVVHVYDGFVGQNESRINSISNESISQFLSSSTSSATCMTNSLESGASSVLDLIDEVFNDLSSLVSKRYRHFDYIGAANATHIVVALGAESTLVENTVVKEADEGKSVGFVKVYVYSPFSVENFLRSLPKTTSRITVLGANDKKSYLYSDVVAAVYSSGHEDVNINEVFLNQQSASEHIQHILTQEPNAIFDPNEKTVLIEENKDELRVFIWNLAEEEQSEDYISLITDEIVSKVPENVQCSLRKMHNNVPSLGSTETYSLITSNNPISVFSFNEEEREDLVLCTNLDILGHFNVAHRLHNNGSLVFMNSDESVNISELLSEETVASIHEKNLDVFVWNPNKVSNEDFVSYVSTLQQEFAKKLNSYSPLVELLDTFVYKGDYLKESPSKEKLETEKDAEETEETEEVVVELQPTSLVPSLTYEYPNETQKSHQSPWHQAAWNTIFDQQYQITEEPRPNDHEVAILEVTEFRRLTGLTYDRNVFHLEMDTRGELKYEIGDALGVFGFNDENEVADFLDFYKVSPTELVSVEINETQKETRTVENWLTQICDLFGKPSKAFYENLANYATDEKEKATLQKISSPEGKLEFKNRADEFVTYNDILREFPSAHPSISDLVVLISKIKPRHYSIASAMSMHPNSVHLLVVVHDWKAPSGKYKIGQCTRYLMNLKPGDKVVTCIKPSVMYLPPDHKQPVIMSGLGTGMAPFRAFIQERAIAKRNGEEIGPMILYFGSRYRSEEYLYGEELEAYYQEGIVSKLQLAFSRDQKEKVYIQHKMVEDGKLLAEYLLNQNGHFYLCGPTWPAADVKDAILEGFKSQGHERKEGEKILEELKEKEQYVLEVY